MKYRLFFTFVGSISQSSRRDSRFCSATFYAPDNLLHVTILDVGTGDGELMPESGYIPLNPTGFIKTMNPQLAILSVAPGDE